MKLKSALGALALISMTVAGTPAAAAPQVSAGELRVIEGFESQYVPARDIFVWLPDDYPDTNEYAVLYMHDGQMLFDASVTWNGQEWGVDEVASRLMAEGAVRDFIVVGIPNAGRERTNPTFFW